MKTSTTLWIIVIIVVILGLGWWWFANSPTGEPAPVATVSNSQTQTSDNASSTVPVTNTAPMSATVTLTSDGFSPSSVTIAKGGTVTFVNQVGTPMWVASDEHPTHTEYDSTSRSTHCAAGYTGVKPFDQCAQGNSYSFTFEHVGSVEYHNHANSSQGGMVVIQ